MKEFDRIERINHRVNQVRKIIKEFEVQ